MLRRAFASALLGLASLAASAGVPARYSPTEIKPAGTPQRYEFDLTAALERAKRENKRLYLYLGAHDCAFCRKYEAFLDKNAAELAPHFAKDWIVYEMRSSLSVQADRLWFRIGDKALPYAAALGCRRVHLMAGLAPAGADRAALRDCYLANLAWAAQQAAKARLNLLIEPINTRDIPGFYLSTTQQALDIRDKVGSTNLNLQYDIYHMQIMEGDLARTVESNLAVINHVQLADNPGRNEPGTGEINYRYLLEHLDRIGYQGWIGCEYKPRQAGAGGTSAGLDWLRAQR